MIAFLQITLRKRVSSNWFNRLISQAYRLLFIEKKAPSSLVLVSGDKDYEPMLADYEKQGRQVAICFYQPVGGGASMSLKES